MERLRKDPPAARASTPVEVLRRRLAAYAGRCSHDPDEEEQPTGLAWR